MRGKKYNRGGTMKNYNMGGTMKNYQDGGANSISNRDAMEMAKEDMIATTAEGMMTPVTLGGNSISNRDVEFMDKVVKGKAKKNKKPKSELPDYRRNMGGTMKNYRAGGIEAADKEGSRLSISMERQEDAGYSPSEADFDQQNRLAAEGIMEVGADVKIIQGHNSRASLGETEGVRGTGAMVKGTKFDGVF